MIDRNKPRKRRPRVSHRRNSSTKVFNSQHNNIPKSRTGISKALEKYTSLAQDAYSNGDRIVAENFYQYAEHYQRLLNEEFRFDSKKPNDDQISQKDDNENSNDINNLKPSRTQRAMNAKKDRLNNKVQTRQGHKNNENDDFTSDGIEALKPFEPSLNKENSQSS